MGNPKPVSVSANTYSNIGNYQTKGVGRWQGTPCPDNRFDCEDSGERESSRFENGAVLFFEASWAINGPSHTDMIVYGTKAGASIIRSLFTARERIPQHRYITVSPSNEKILLEITHFADCVLNGKTPK